LWNVFMAFVRALLCCSVVFAVPAMAQPQLADINKKTVTLLAGEPAWFGQAQSIADGVAHEQGLRVIPMQGTGCVDAAADVLQLTQVDMALLSSDCLSYVEQQGLLPKASQKLAYIARIKSVPLVMITRIDVPNLTALAGKRIATGPANSAGFASGEILLGGLGLPFVRVPLDGNAAIAALKRGEADAVLLQGLEALDGSLDPAQFRVLGLTTAQGAASPHAPALIEAAELQGLLAEGQSLETVSTALVLAVFKWPETSPKAAKIKLFSNVYFEKEAFGNKASELSTSVPGLTRHSSAVRALEVLQTDNPDSPAFQQGDGP
jgi:ABC-type amino acid transport substrate-binding protein